MEQREREKILARCTRWVPAWSAPDDPAETFRALAERAGPRGDIYGGGESVKRLEARVAELLGKEAADAAFVTESPEGTALRQEVVLAVAGLKRILDSPFATTSGMAKASAFKLIDLATASKRDTQDLHTFSPLGGPGGSSFAGAHGAFFWTGFTRVDSAWDQIHFFNDSPSDRVVHMAVVQINLPRPTGRPGPARHAWTWRTARSSPPWPPSGRWP